MMAANNNTSSGSSTTSIFELVERTRKFIRFELAHAGVAVAIFFGIFLVLQPWNYSSGSSEDRPYWMAGLPLIYFMVDLSLATMLLFTMFNEILRPKICKLWMILQVGNLVQLTLLGFFMIWQIEFVDYTYLKLIVTLLVLYVYKSYRISIMQRLVLEMKARCSSSTCINDNGTSGNSSSSAHNHQISNREQPAFLRPNFMISVQQPEANRSPPVGLENVKQESSA